jgi:TPR repeat protein
MGRLGLVALFLVSACAPGGPASALRPEAPKYADAAGEVACTIPLQVAKPLAVDWQPADRGDLEVEMKRGIAVVEYDCKSARVLRDCQVEGSYGFVGTPLKEQIVRLDDANEISANLPFSGGKLAGQMARGASLDVAVALVGQRVATRPQVARSDLKGDCEHATHFVRAASVGAFVMKSNTSAQLETAADVFAFSASGQSASAASVLNRDGDPEVCRGTDPDDAQAPSKCSSLVRMEFKAIADNPPLAAPDPLVEYATTNTCPSSLVSVAEKCARPRDGVPHLCEYGSQEDCSRQCAGGDAASCTRLGLMHERGEGVEQSAPLALVAYQHACERADIPGCSRAGALKVAAAHDESEAHAGLLLLKKACNAGWSAGCDGIFAFYRKHPMPADTNLFALVERGCAGGSGDSCATLGLFYSEGLGTQKDAERAVYFYRTGCTAGSTTACVYLAGAYQQGAGVDKDFARAAELLNLTCSAGSSGGCDALAVLYFKGEGVPQSDAKGVELLSKACDGGSAGSCFVLGLRYRRGMGVTKDATAGNKYLKRACDGGHPIACEQLAKQ